MNRSRRRAIVAGSAMVASVAFAEVAKPRHRLSDSLPPFELERDVPAAFGAWQIDPTMVPVLPSPDVAATLNRIYDQTVGRTYVRPTGERVMLSIAYGGAQTRELRAHRQEVCYSAQGFQVRSLKRETIIIDGAPIPATLMVARMGNRVEPVTYWFTMGAHAVMSLWDRQWVQFQYSLRGLIPDGFLMRFSTIGDDAKQAFALHLEFAQELLSHTEPVLRSRMLGRG